MPRRPRAKSRRLAATKFPLKHLKSDSSAAARMMLTIQRDANPVTPGLLERDGRHEFFAGQPAPWSHECDRRDDAGVEENADKDCHPDGAKEASRAEVRAGLFCGLAHRFEAGHEIGDDLNDQQNRNQRSVREQWLDIGRRAAANAEGHKYDEEASVPKLVQF